MKFIAAVLFVVVLIKYATAATFHPKAHVYVKGTSRAQYLCLVIGEAGITGSPHEIYGIGTSDFKAYQNGMKECRKHAGYCDVVWCKKSK